MAYVVLPQSTQYAAKDQLKADVSNKFIGLGSEASSTNAYRKAYGDMANCGVYTEDDVVFISAEGNRRNRWDTPWDEMDKAIKAGVEFVTDDSMNRSRPYNVGERLVAQYLTNNGYKEVLPGRWVKIK